ncbi:Vacuolar membrane protein [Tolypocladium paradoxum]|uniref:Vacuolar membrane protein n=1 Tax=Tolypocladium paradoxum TaxID=94208 RepID=A0A2S4L138_9HYPO|nr:Vacuolar membrane protein [Tolypocladium paradoxum]
MRPVFGIRATQDASPVTIGVDAPTAAAAVIVETAMATIATALAAATSSPTSPPDGPPHDEPGQGECQLLGPFALLVQAALGALALLSLVYKRWRERPQRPLKIWFFDVSKQVFGSVLVHIANIFMSMLTSGRFSIKLEPGPTQRLMARGDDDPYIPNPCSFYLLNLAIDVSTPTMCREQDPAANKHQTTVGIPILIILLRILTGLVAFTPLGKPSESIQSGNYGNPPNAWWWLKQSIIYFGGLFGMKLCVLIIFVLLPWISKVGDWALGWTEGNERLQIAFVMMIFPLIMNGLQYYIIDSFIKKKETEHERLASEDPDEAEHCDCDADNEPVKSPPRVRNSGDEYDPDTDGDAPTVIGSSSSRRIERTKVVPTELFPKE